MGEFVNGLLGGSSVNKMAEAMQTAPRSNPMDRIDGQKMQEQQQQAQQPAPGQQAPEQAPPQGNPEEQALNDRQSGKPQGKAAAPFDGPILDENAPDVQGDPSTGAALPPPSPGEEQQARTLMANVTDFMYGEGLQKVTKFLKAEGDLPVAVGETTAMLVSSQLDAAEAAGQEVSPNILMSVGAEIVSQMYELASALGVWAPADEKQADKDMSLSLNYATNMFAKTQIETGRKDRLTGLTDAMQGIQNGEYDSKPGQALTNDMAPVQSAPATKGLL